MIKPSEDVELVGLEQNGNDVLVRIDNLVALACYSDGRRLELNQKWLLEKGYRIDVVS